MPAASVADGLPRSPPSYSSSIGDETPLCVQGTAMHVLPSRPTRAQLSSTSRTSLTEFTLGGTLRDHGVGSPKQSILHWHANMAPKGVARSALRGGEGTRDVRTGEGEFDNNLHVDEELFATHGHTEEYFALDVSDGDEVRVLGKQCHVWECV